MTGESEYLRARDIARLTGVSIRTARRWIAKRILVSGKVGGARLVAKSELERLLSPASDLDEDDEKEPPIKPLRVIGRALCKNTSHV
jgi:excisionase family DNA binding protein